MTVLDSFYILFKSNSDEAVAATKKVEAATKSVQAATAELLKAQEDAGQKVGKNLTDQEKQILSLQQKRKAAMNEQRQAEKEQAEADKQKLETGGEFVKIIEKATAAAAAYVSVGALVSGVFDTAKSNSDLKVQADLLGQSASNIKAIGQAAEAFGAKPGELLGHYKDVFARYANTGQNIGSPEDLIRFYRKKLESPQYSTPQARSRFFQANSVPEGVQSYVNASPADFEKQIAFDKQLVSGSEAGIQAGRDLQKAWSNTGASLDSVFTQLGARILPILIKFTDAVVNFDKYLNEHPKIADTLITGIAALAGVLTVGVVGSIVTGLGSIAIAAGAAAAPFIALGAGIGGVYAAFSNMESKETSDKNWSKTHNGQAAPYLPTPGAKLTRGLRNNNPGNLRSWGDTPTEGGFAKFGSADDGVRALSRQLELYDSRGNNTIGGIISKYAPSSENNTAAYIAAVSKSTGFDANSPLNIHDPNVRASLMAAIIQHENGQNPYGNKQILGMIGAGQQNIGVASTSSYGMTPIPGGGNSKSTSIKVGDIHVHTQATSSDEISRNVASELMRHLNHLTASVDDGIKA